MIGFLKPAPHIERLPEDKIDSTYKRYRIQMFISIYIGYAMYYFVRSNFSIAKNYMITELGFTKTELGFIASGMLASELVCF